MSNGDYHNVQMLVKTEVHHVLMHRTVAIEPPRAALDWPAVTIKHELGAISEPVGDESQDHHQGELKVQQWSQTLEQTWHCGLLPIV